MPTLILASTSVYRRTLLDRLRIAFDCATPAVDEAPIPGERAASLSLRLAHAKATAVASQHPDAWVIGSDQAANLHGQILGKPHTRVRAIAQLTACSGQTVGFHTAVVLHGPGRVFEHVDLTEVRFRTLDEEEISRYVDAEQPFDCAGSFKCEGLGISLFDAICSEDPTALVGLPMIRLADMLRRAGFALP